MKILGIRGLFLLLSLDGVSLCSANEQDPRPPRTVITTDGEVDDINSFIRLLLYANAFDFEGFVYSSSMWHYSGDGNGTRFTSEMPMTRKLYGEQEDLRWTGTEWIEHLIDLYAEVYPNLSKHETGYPTPESLRPLIRVGNIKFEGEMEEDTPGSDLIRQLLLDDERGPLYLQAWGGANTIARALRSIERDYARTDGWDELHRRISNKAILYLVTEQDATYENYIAPHWPALQVLLNHSQHEPIGYAWHRVNDPETQRYLAGPWQEAFIKKGHGPLTAHYFLWGDGQHTEGDPQQQNGRMEVTREAGRQQYDFISEGDTLAILALLDNGLRNLEGPSFGGWGGRFFLASENPLRWEANKEQTHDYHPTFQRMDGAYPVGRWIPAFQNDFAARADWCVLPYEEANHPPKVRLQGPLDLKVKPGEEVRLKGSAEDPDGDEVTLRWWQYREAGTFPGDLVLSETVDGEVRVKVLPSAKENQTIHLILEGEDSGSPPLTRYQRVVLTVSELGPDLPPK